MAGIKRPSFFSRSRARSFLLRLFPFLAQHIPGVRQDILEGLPVDFPDRYE
jgi:hypothetical protein